MEGAAGSVVARFQWEVFLLQGKDLMLGHWSRAQPQDGYGHQDCRDLERRYDLEKCNPIVRKRNWWPSKVLVLFACTFRVMSLKVFLK